jgi:hypothetical protein
MPMRNPPRTTLHPARVRPYEWALARRVCPGVVTRRTGLDPREALIGEPGSAVFGKPGGGTSTILKALMLRRIHSGHRPLARAMAPSGAAAGEAVVSMNQPQTASLGPLGPLTTFGFGPIRRETRGR